MPVLIFIPGDGCRSLLSFYDHHWIYSLSTIWNSNMALTECKYLCFSKLQAMKFGVVVFPGSNCDRDIHDALVYDLKAGMYHACGTRTATFRLYSTDDCIVLPGGFSYGDYLRTGAIARFSPVMQAVIEFAQKRWESFGYMQWIPDPLRIAFITRCPC